MQPTPSYIHKPSGLSSLLLLCLGLLGACNKSTASSPKVTALLPATHTKFQIAQGAHAVDCNACHGGSASFTKGFQCLGCHVHEQAPTDQIHTAVPPVLGTYRYESTACYSCHQADDGQRHAFSHPGITRDCALCHGETASFAALPALGVVHEPFGNTDCGSCHVTAGWGTSGLPAGLVSDPAQAVGLAVQLPTWSGTTISGLTTLTLQMPMPMLHGPAQLGLATQGGCATCHAQVSAGSLFPGKLHAALTAIGAAQPTTCAECHADSAPQGFVGAAATTPPRSPASGGMRHDALSWSGETLTGDPLVTQDCSLCHVAPPPGATAAWTIGLIPSAPVQFHASLARSSSTQPTSCLDCHANGRPALLTSANAAGLPPGLVYDHAVEPALSDCAACHAASGPFTSWAGGRHHRAADAAPSSCLPCHAGERPTATMHPTSTWASQTFAQSPFDFLTNGLGIGHGNGNDCAVCHAGPGGGAWGSSQDWTGGTFPHGANTDAATTCVACHSAQRPDLQPGAIGSSAGAVLGFDHAVNGRGDCAGCHQASVAAGRYATYAFPGGDWKDGQLYPGPNLIGSTSQFVLTTQLTLLRTSLSKPSWITGFSTRTATLYNQFLHTSAAIPAVFGLGGAGGAPDTTQCWHCHVHDAAGKVTAFSDGQYHASLDHFTQSLGGAEVRLAQPAGRCADCHTQRPSNLVLGKLGTPPTLSSLVPMDHAAQFAAAATLGGLLVGSADALDCSTCHSSPGATWADGVFHANLGAASPNDCAVCHYPLMAEKATADRTSGSDYAMLHGSPQLPVQNCKACHASALARASNTPSTASAWTGGTFHASTPVQPIACNDCHAVSTPLASTAGAVVYALPLGGTGSNRNQWMSHASQAVVGRDCAICHAADATSAAAWSRSAPFHSHASPTACQGCHGLGNGSTAAGANNNLPVGLTDSTVVSSAGSDPASGVPAGTHDQLTHVDPNVASRDCNFCHTQAGPSLAAGIAGKEWAQARFHASFTGGATLLLDGATGRCSNCHANLLPTGPVTSGLRPGLSYDHRLVSTQTDCAACHAAPASVSSWLGGNYHHAGDPAPTSCLPCHGGERPTALVNATSSWLDATYRAAPFDFLTNAQGATHGNGNDCAICHAGPGSSAWGGSQTWQRGAFLHGPATDSASTCIACHASQRPDLQAGTVGSTAAAVLGFDHAQNGRGDCFGCHQATVAAKSYAQFTFPGGGWKGGQQYPGSSLIGSTLQSISTTVLTLLRSSAANPALVTGVSTSTVLLPNLFLHTSSAIPAAFGLSATPDTTRCWHCHTNDGAGRVTSFADGKFHLSLDRFTASPGGPVAPLAQPAGRCTDCHTQRPANVVEKAVGSPPLLSDLQPMDHAAAFVAAVTLGGVSATGAGSLDCGACHASPGSTWTDGTFHKNVGAAVPKDCTVCHYPLMARAAASDKLGGSDYAMKHRSSQLSVQNCQLCHGAALARGVATPLAASLWSGGLLHASLTAQPTSCADCHAVSTPAGATSSTVAYALPAGATASNRSQWMTHTAAAVAANDCALCHAPDARTTGSAWSRSAPLHPRVSPAACQGCHGLKNGSSVAGTNNNLPVGLTDSTTLTTASSDPATGIPAGTHDQISHADVNVAAYDCNLCHTQAGASTSTAIAGKEWAQAKFHASFSGSVKLVSDGAAGRCSNCHLNVKPGPTFTSFDHSALTQAPGSLDCAACHLPQANWLNSLEPTLPVSDPAQSLVVTALAPTWSGSSISRLTAQSQNLAMPMLHTSPALAAAALSTCGNCHAKAGAGTYFPGTLHAALATLGLPQPATCADCHAASVPTGFVGPTSTAPARSPPSGGMKHDAVAWTQLTKTAAPIVTQDCAICHGLPAAGALAPWKVGTATSTPAQYHASLAQARLAQPASCLDCHANTRPALLTAGGAALPAGLTYNHGAAPALADCIACHAGAAASTSWAGGRHHHAGDATPSSCLPCHAGERPSATVRPTTSWVSGTYASSPFDYLTNAQGIGHGNGKDCVACHAGPGTGAWGSTQNWASGLFVHGPSSDSATTCIACHASQRPDLQAGTIGSTAAAVLGFDHAASGKGDCLGCHQATVAAGFYVRYAFPGGDWKGGLGYPGATLVGSSNRFSTSTTFTLLRANGSNPTLVTGISSSTASLSDRFLHTSTAIPAAFGLSANPDTTRCWHCHTNDGAGHLTAVVGGLYHSSLARFTATPGGTITPLPETPGRCLDCHALAPANLVEKAVGSPPLLSDLQPMDHAAAFVAAVTLGGVSATGAGSLDCGACHASPGATWADGTFHKNVGAAVPKDCTVCHYPLMARAAASDKLSGSDYAMRHGSSQLSVQNCQLCHGAALARGVATPLTAALWSGGAFHASVAAQPTVCADCHAVSAPALSTSGAVVYALPLGATATNQPQWMSHASAALAGKDCASCHAAEARASVSAWSKSAPLHPRTIPTTCQDCHGLQNGSSVAGTNNNLPAGLVNSTTLTSGASNPATGIPAGTYDQLSHTDRNVTRFDCSFCHTQAGTSSAPGIAGKEWAQATFHANFTGSVQLAIDGGVGRCSNCHLNGKPTSAFTAFDHGGLSSASGTQDCSACHQAGPSWVSSVVPIVAVSDPAQDLLVSELVATWSGTSITRVTAQAETLPMEMLHSSPALSATALSACGNCHLNSDTGVFYPGALHASLSDLKLPQPASCADCHAASVPIGFVGPAPTTTPRNPPSGEMNHGAVAWNLDTKTTTPLVTQSCGVCHAVPVAILPAPWTLGTGSSTPVQFHASLTRAGLPQPTSCLDCHANTRPAQLTPATAALAAGLSYDHRIPPAQSDCVACHFGPGSFSSWSGGLYHHSGVPTPVTCLQCHGGERPSAALHATSTWQSATYRNRPFDYLTNAQGVTHGNGGECILCHAPPANGVETWANGSFPHGSSTNAASTCIACHASQRPDLQAGWTAASASSSLHFDHAMNGTGDCIGCHAATVAAGSYATYTFPGGDWKGGQAYPGSSLVGSNLQFVKTTLFTLLRTSPSNPTLVTTVSTSTATLYNQFLHTSPAIHSSFGLVGNPPPATVCWHCHTNDGAGHVTSFSNGQYHPSLSSFVASPGGAVAPLPQPTSRCTDCHNVRPSNIVAKPVGVPLTPSELQPMDHAALFVSPVVLGGVSATSASSLDCSSCHAQPGVAWTDGTFHKNTPTAVPLDCTVCHYQLMADATASDKSSGTLYAMQHGSAQLTFQNCKTCHTNALASGATTPIAAALWAGGLYHPSLPAQPPACLDCHAVTVPAGATQSSLTYTLPLGGTATNGAQWMNHASPRVSGLDCFPCHARDAKVSGSAWSKADSFHAAVPSSTSCKECHGLTNGGGSVLGTNNNLPAGLTNSTVTSTAALDPTTGVAAGTRDQISHADFNVSSRDCNFCHTQAGTSSVAAIKGKEWAQATFHPHFTGTAALDMTSGRCSNCHLGLKPGAAFLAYNHAAVTATSTDCAACHAAPPARNDWLGAAGAPATIVVGGFAVPLPPATTATTEAGIANLPHPTLTATSSCASCHAGGIGGKGAFGYDHKSSLISKACNTCHEAGSNLLAVKWNGTAVQASGLGDTRPFTLAPLTPSICNKAIASPGPHFYPSDCGLCHKLPAGNGTSTSSTAYKTAWKGSHPPKTGSTSALPCSICHSNGCN